MCKQGVAGPGCCECRYKIGRPVNEGLHQSCMPYCCEWDELGAIDPNRVRWAVSGEWLIGLPATVQVFPNNEQFYPPWAILKLFGSGPWVVGGPGRWRASVFSNSELDPTRFDVELSVNEWRSTNAAVPTASLSSTRTLASGLGVTTHQHYDRNCLPASPFHPAEPAKWYRTAAGGWVHRATSVGSPYLSAAQLALLCRDRYGLIPLGKKPEETRFRVTVSGAHACAASFNGTYVLTYRGGAPGDTYLYGYAADGLSMSLFSSPDWAWKGPGEWLANALFVQKNGGGAGTMRFVPNATFSVPSRGLLREATAWTLVQATSTCGNYQDSGTGLPAGPGPRPNATVTVDRFLDR